MTLSFLKNFVLAGGRQAAENLTQAIVTAAPDLATDAELATLEDHLDSAGSAITRLQTELTREQREYDSINAQYSQMMGAAQVLQGQIDDPTTSEVKRDSLTASLANHIVKIEALVPQLDQERQDVVDVKNLLADAEAAYKDKTTALTSRRAELARAKHDLEHSRIQEERAAGRAEDARIVAGLKKNSNTGIDTALTAIRGAADAARERAAAHNLKANALIAAKALGEGDENVRAAMEQAKGQSTPQSLSDRLAALKR